MDVTKEKEQAALSVLFYGDSIDRYDVSDWCKYHKVEERDFGPASLQYGGHYGVQHSPAYCTNAYRDEAAAVHIYGSNPDYPYFMSSHEISMPLPGQIRNTTHRIVTAFAEYSKEFGKPTRIFWTSGNWDSAISVSLAQFTANTIHALKLLRQVVNDINVDIGLRTAVTRSNWGLVNDYNGIYRQLSKDHNITLYDYDLDIWSTLEDVKTADNEDLLFRSGQKDNHPQSEYCIEAVDKMLGRRFSSFFHIKGQDCMEHVYSSLPDSLRRVNFMRSAHSSELFFTHVVDGVRQRWSTFDQRLPFRFKMSPGDIMTVSDELLKSVPLLGPFPPIFYWNETVETLSFVEKRRGIITDEQNMYMLFYDNIFHVQSNASFPFFDVTDFLYDIPDYIFDIRFISPHEVMHSCFQNKRLVRFHKDQQIWLLENNEKHAIMSMGALISRGYDAVDDVTLLSKRNILDVIPTGDSLF